MKPVFYLAIFLGLMSLWTAQNEASADVPRVRCGVGNWPAAFQFTYAFGTDELSACTALANHMETNINHNYDDDSNGVLGEQENCGDSGAVTFDDENDRFCHANSNGTSEHPTVNECVSESTRCTPRHLQAQSPCADGEEIDPLTGECKEPLECPEGQVPNEAETECECENPDMSIGAGGECVPNCPVYQQWNQDLQRCDFECENMAGKTMTCKGLPGELPSGGCNIGCQVVTSGGIEVMLASDDMLTRTYKYTGEYCPSASPWAQLCTEDGEGELQEGDQEGAEEEQEGETEICSPGDELCTDTDAESGTKDGQGFSAPSGGGECVSGPGNVIACEGGQAEGDDGVINKDGDGDGATGGEGDSEVIISDRVGSNVPEGAIVVGSDGRQVGKARDCDGDGVTDGIDSTGDGLCDTTSPDGAPDGEGGGGGGECDPEEEECSDQPPGSVGGAGQCEEPPECIPSDDPDSALRCAMVNMQWKISCQFYVDTDELSGGSSLADDLPQDSGDFLWLDEEELEEDIPAIETDVVNWGNQCPNDLEFQAFGESYAIGISSWCGWLQQAGAFLVIMALMLGGRIIYAVIF